MTGEFHPARKATLLIPSGSTNHLHFICCDPVYYPNKVKDCVLLVNISTIDVLLAHDPTCILQPGDHPFIRHPSYVYYRKADIFGADSISRSVAEGDFIIHQPCEEEPFSRILSGFDASDEVRLKIKNFYSKYCQ
jgi:hypothetical protein